MWQVSTVKYLPLRDKYSGVGQGDGSLVPLSPDIISKAILLDSSGVDVGRAKSNNSLLMHSLYAVADIGNGLEIIKLYVEEMNDSNTENTSKRAYQLQNVEKYQLQNGSSQKMLAP